MQIFLLYITTACFFAYIQPAKPEMRIFRTDVICRTLFLFIFIICKIMQQKYLALNLVHRKYVAFLIIYTFSCEKVRHEEVKNLYGDP